ncbi:MAG: hypothetical protein US50_C0014G0003 [Candidatus Nomurabacteria bacterium GW2011_GWB1_37_5]|uniref:AI-2E family transporter n=1 Tax=Candidatus Nomurabacteria bacterium GW2011_GWB1_37_5 TaxID=1618742 RepID=A0A0G0K487_9BACT|nr:MAG: hypothetical protein US50_C0014G0003 [Candidatus Nomurabacteria bacterium GW2011_GWB1_37_5]
MDKNININISNISLLRVVFWGVLVVAIYYLRDVVLVILTSIVIASFVELVLSKFSIFKIHRTLGVVLIYVLSALLLAGLFYIFIPVFVGEMSGLSALLSDYLPQASFLQGFEKEAAEGAKEITKTISNNVSLGGLIEGARSLVSNLSAGFLETLVSVFGGVLNLLLIIIISFYLSIKERGIEAFLKIVTPLMYEEYVISLWQRTEKKIALWVQGQFLLSLMVGILTFLGLMILGVKYAFLIALFTAVFELIPFGLILAVIPALTFAYVDGGISLLLWVAGLYIIIQQFENYLLQPLVIKKVVGISPLVVILALLIGARLAGFWGILLGIPVAVAILELMEDLEHHKVRTKVT